METPLGGSKRHGPGPEKFGEVCTTYRLVFYYVFFFFFCGGRNQVGTGGKAKKWMSWKREKLRVGF
jgi:hypothetical protein